MKLVLWLDTQKKLAEEAITIHSRAMRRSEGSVIQILVFPHYIHIQKEWDYA